MAGLLTLAVISVAALVCQTLWPHPLHLAGITVDRLSGMLTLLVGMVGSVTFRFALRYLDGEPRKARFLNLLCATVCSAYVLVLSTNLILLFVAWSLTSLWLHNLLTFYPDRKESLAPARKKFLISRLGDVALIAAIGLVWREWNTTDLNVFLARLHAGRGIASATVIAVLVTIAALTKSAQFPFHSWLPETMESPTPVSALMHAGVINAGGALVLRFSPLIAMSPAALCLLTMVGTLTAALGMVSMWAQVKVKRTLAWSTVSQMGFMMVQCGLGTYPAAALHMVGHGCYKAWSFLRAGSLPVSKPVVVGMPAWLTLVLAGVGTLMAVPALYLASRITGFNPRHNPGELALVAVVALSIGQVWVALFRIPSSGIVQHGLRLTFAIALTTAATVLALSLYRGSQLFLAPVLGSMPGFAGPWAWVLAAVPVATFSILVALHAALPELTRTTAGRAFYVHALHGFYFGALADRLVERLWNIPAREELAHG